MPAKIEIPILIVCLVILILIILAYVKITKLADAPRKASKFLSEKLKPVFLSNVGRAEVRQDEVKRTDVRHNIGNMCEQYCYANNTDDAWDTASCLKKC
jgi:hypothetical protein